MAGIFGEFFLVSVSHETKHENSSKIRGKFGAKFGAKFGTEFEKFGELSFCNFSDLTGCLSHFFRERSGLCCRPCRESRGLFLIGAVKKAENCDPRVPLQRSKLENQENDMFGVLVTRIAATSNRKSLATAIATQKNHCDSESTCKTAISLRFLREKLATSKL